MSFYLAVSWIIPKYRSSYLPSTSLQVCHLMLLFNSKLRTMHNIKHPYMKTEKEPAQDQRLWEKETEEKGYKKIDMKIM